MTSALRPSGATDAIVDLARGCDILIHMNHLFSGIAPTPAFRDAVGHHNGNARAAQRAGVKTLVLVSTRKLLMRFATAMVPIAIVAVSGLAPAQAQQRPSFAGEWVLADTAGRRPSISSQGDASFRTGSMGSGWGSPLTITQEPTRLIVEYPYFSAYDLQPPIRLIYLLDGQEFRNSVMIGHATSLLRSRATWRGDTLVITTAFPVPDRGADPAMSEIRRALTLESPERLVVETTRAGPSGSAAALERTVYSRP